MELFLSVLSVTLIVIIVAINDNNRELIKKNTNLVRENHRMSSRIYKTSIDLFSTQRKLEAVETLLKDQNEIINSLTIRKNADKSVK